MRTSPPSCALNGTRLIQVLRHLFEISIGTKGQRLICPQSRLSVVGAPWRADPSGRSVLSLLSLFFSLTPSFFLPRPFILCILSARFSQSCPETILIEASFQVRVNHDSTAEKWTERKLLNLIHHSHSKKGRMVGTRILALTCLTRLLLAVLSSPFR